MTRITPTGRTLSLVTGERPAKRTELPTRAEYLNIALGFATRQLSEAIAAGTAEDFLIIKLAANDEGKTAAETFTTSDDAEVIGVAILALQRYGLKSLQQSAEEDDGD